MFQNSTTPVKFFHEVIDINKIKIRSTYFYIQLSIFLKFPISSINNKYYSKV